MFYKKIPFLRDYSQKRLQRQGYNQAHLAVLFDQPTWFDDIKDLKKLLVQQNDLKLTPMQLAVYLNRRQCLEKFFPSSVQTIKVEKKGVIENLSIFEFEQKMGIEYLPNLIFQSLKGLKEVLVFHQKAHKKKWISHEEKWLGVYFQKELIKGLYPSVFIKWISPSKGYGLFADQDLRKRAWIGQYTGTVRKSNFRKDQKNAYCFEYFSKSKFTIDAKEKGNITRFINHSYQPNLMPRLVFLESILHIVFVAAKEIKKGEELTYDYGIDYWKKRETPI